MSWTKDETEKFLELRKKYESGKFTSDEELEYFKIICGGDESEARFMIAREKGNLPEKDGDEVYKY